MTRLEYRNQQNGRNGMNKKAYDAMVTDCSTKNGMDMKKLTLAMMKDPTTWSLYPNLPIKHTILKDHINPQFPMHGIFSIRDTPIVYKEVALFKYEQIEYESIEAIVEDGWIVD
jgi:hypothetical protein